MGEGGGKGGEGGRQGGFAGGRFDNIDFYNMALLQGAHESQARQVELVNRLQVGQFRPLLLNMGYNDDFLLLSKH